jgi:formate dehydrogenase alpha subunit
MGTPLEYAESRDILKEIRSLIPGYGSLGPAPLPSRVDHAAITRYLTDGYRHDLAARYKLGVAAAQPDGIVQLELVQSLFHSGKLSTRSRGLMEVEGSGALRINPQDAARFALKDGDRVRLSNVRGEMTTTITIRERVPHGSAWLPDHFSQTSAHLFDCILDPVTRTPSIRTTSVSMMKVA